LRFAKVECPTLLDADLRPPIRDEDVFGLPFSG
jgi:hypothetical protein